MRVYAILNPLRSALRWELTACLRDHHRQLAAMVVGVAHALSKERGLQPATAQFR